jgi:hypothetical protein
MRWLLKVPNNGVLELPVSFLLLLQAPHGSSLASTLVAVVHDDTQESTKELQQSSSFQLSYSSRTAYKVVAHLMSAKLGHFISGPSAYCTS